MYDVPVLVKDALREGVYKKNYRFNVLKPVEKRDIADLAELTRTSFVYTLETQCDDDNECVVHAEPDGTRHEIGGWVLWPNNSRYPFTFVMSADEEAYMTLDYGVLPVGTKIYFADSPGEFGVTTIPSGVTIGITDENHVITFQDWALDFEINNDNLVSESVGIDERMCSGDELTFGLCEGSSLEFQYFEKPNITGKRLQTFIDVDYNGEGWQTLETLTSSSNTYTCERVAHYQLIIPSYSVITLSVTHYGQTTTKDYATMIMEGIVNLGYLNAGDVISVTSDSEFYVDLQEDTSNCSIPLGYFIVKSCSRQASTGILKVSAYNKLQSDYLDQKANEYIEEIASDNSDPNKISVKSIIDKLLQGYADITVDNRSAVVTSMPAESGPRENLSTLKLIGDSTTYYTSVYTLSSKHHDYYIMGNAQNNTLRYEIENTAQLAEIFERAANDLKDIVVNIVQSGDTYWNNNKAVILKYSSMHVVFEDGKEAYFGGESLIALTPSSANISYRNIAEAMYLQGVTTNTSVQAIEFTLPSIGLFTSSSRTELSGLLINRLSFYDAISVCKMPLGNDVDNILVAKSSLPDVTLREIMSANYETLCQYGQLSRITDLFSSVELNRSRLLPADTLYPSDSLYPDGGAESGFRSQYSKLWADEGNVHKWRYLIITYKGLDGDNNEAEFTLQRTVNADGTDDYNMSDNWLFRNLVWTASDVGDYADAMVAKMQDITWFPFEMWCAGLPYLETGDEIEIPLGEETYTSYILQRQLKGIQNLQDTYINGTLDIF